MRRSWLLSLLLAGCSEASVPPPPRAAESAPPMAASAPAESAAPAPPPAPAAAAAGPRKDKLDHEEIKAGLSPVTAAVQACYDRLKVPGTVFLRLRIGADGRVVSSEATGRFAGSETGACVARAVEAARFATFDGPTMSVNYSFKLEEDE